MSAASSPAARSSAAAALSGSLPSARAAKRGREEHAEGDAGADSDDGQVLNDEVYREFDEHIKAIAAARDRKRERLAFKSAAEEPDEAAGGGAKVETEDQRDQLGEWLPGDQYQGTVNMRTLKQLLGRIDARGFERSAQQLEFHEAFFRACGRVIYKDNWATDKPQIMKAEGWTKCNSEVLISTPRRFGKTRRFSLQSVLGGASRAGAHAELPSFVLASPSRWASRSSSSVSRRCHAPRGPMTSRARLAGPAAAPRASFSSASSSKLRFFEPQTRAALRRGCAGSCGSRAASRASSSSTWRRAGSTPSTGARASSAAFRRK